LSHHPATEVGVDIFDTVLVRRLVGEEAAERAAASAVVSAGLWPGTVDELLAARREGERADPSAPLSTWLRHPAFDRLEDPDEAERIEVTIEGELVVAVPGAAEAVDRLRTLRRLVFVSDMHLDGDTLRDLLVAEGVARPDDEVVVSCQHGSSKSGGGLYPVAFPSLAGAGRLSRRPIFIGNNPWADTTRAAAAGLRPAPALAANPSPLEEVVARRPGTRGPAIAGAARLVRLRHHDRSLSDHEKAMRTIGAATIGQIMAAFLLWVADRCRQRDRSEIRFVARDGRLPFEMAKRMPSDHWHGARLGYLRASRRAWSLAAATAVGVDRWIEIGTLDRHSFLLHAAHLVPFPNVLARCGLDHADLPARSELARRDRHRPLTAGEVDQWCELLRSGQLNEAIAKASYQPHQLLIEHLRSSDLPDRPLALVDVGWRGQQSWLVSALLAEATGHEPTHLHFGGDGTHPRIDALIDVERFALDDSVRPHPISNPVGCLELFLGNGEPRVVGYRQAGGGKVEEILDQDPTEVANRAQQLLVAGACELADALPSRVECDRWGLTSDHLDDEARDLLSRIWGAPGRSEAELLAGLAFEHDDEGNVISPAVVPYTLPELAGRTRPVRTWRAGSLAATPVWLRPVARTALAVSDLLSG
jgi:hypothetical protein